MPTLRSDFWDKFSPFAKDIFLPFAKQFPVQFIQGKRHCRLAYRHFIHSTPAEKLVILVNGRAENLLKWTIPAWEFYQQGFDVLVMDHRGQGYSQRFLSNPQKGYVDEFRFYIDDLAHIIKHATTHTAYTKQYLLGHSMGGLISSYYLANCDHHIKKAVLSAPFFGIPSQHPLRDEFLVNMMMLFGQGHRYLFGHSDYSPKLPEDNDLTHSAENITWQNAIIAHYPQLALGGATFRWLHLCWQAIHSLPTILPRIEIPVMVLQAEKEMVVNNQRLSELVHMLPHGDLHLVQQAKHEILFEKESINAPIFDKISRFFT